MNIACVTLLDFLGGCGTLVDAIGVPGRCASPGEFRIYGVVRTDIEEGGLLLIDLPLSLALNTALLPFTAVNALIHELSKGPSREERERAPDGKEKKN